jgi:hypothetical protein
MLQQSAHVSDLAKATVIDQFRILDHPSEFVSVLSRRQVSAAHWAAMLPLRGDLALAAQRTAAHVLWCWGLPNTGSTVARLPYSARPRGNGAARRASGRDVAVKREVRGRCGLDRQRVTNRAAACSWFGSKTSTPPTRVASHARPQRPRAGVRWCACAAARNGETWSARAARFVN